MGLSGIGARVYAGYRRIWVHLWVEFLLLEGKGKEGVLVRLGSFCDFQFMLAMHIRSCPKSTLLDAPNYSVSDGPHRRNSK